ncbi:MAG: gamma-glutamyltransferase [Pirellulaceae bacterium]|nr:gamma-glutamyltransferase [Pirellulaceae bacterium]
MIRLDFLIRLVLVALIAGNLCCVSAGSDISSCVITSVHPLATRAGENAFEQGGNAVDAAIATALTLGVVDNHNSGIGGGCFILIRTPDGQITAIDGREMAPAAATADMYVRDAKAIPELSQTGALAIAVPGALAAYQQAGHLHGQQTLADHLLPAAKIADEGFAIDEAYAQKLADKADQLALFPASRNQLLHADGSPYRHGERLRQPDLANTYRAIANHGTDWFYKGPFAKTVATWMANNGGLLTAADFANYHTQRRQPIVTRYRDWKIIGFPPPSSGGTHVAQILNMLESVDLRREHDADPVRTAHLIIEAMKLAFADRAHWLGDADFAKVPKALIDKTYANDLFKKINRNAATAVPRHGDAFAFGDDVFGKHTTHIAAADSDGYWVAITATVNTTFGSKVIVPGTGVVLNNEMDDFSSQVGVPNAFGLIGAQNNAIAPGKRPLSSMSPTIVLNQDDQPVLTVGAAGGPKIITQVLLAIIRTLDFDDNLQQAVAAPRFHHQWRPDVVLVERTMPSDTIDGLKTFGHNVRLITHTGITQAIERRPDGQLIGVHDPRVSGKTGYATRKPIPHRNQVPHPPLTPANP